MEEAMDAAMDLVTARPRCDVDFETLLGRPAWRRLDPDVRRGFAASAQAGAGYAGMMHKVRCSLAGFALAGLLCALGTPFATHAGDDVPTTIELIPTAEGLVWERTYRFPGRAPVVVRSTKAV